MKRTVCIAILNYSGRDLLEKYLPSFERAVQKSRHQCRVAVLDNQSSDGSPEWVRSHFPSMEVYRAPENRVLCSYNWLARQISDEFIVCMNNDIAAEAGFIDPLIDPFLSDPNVFFVTPKCLGKDRRTYEGNRTKSRIRFGLYWSSARYPGYERDIDCPGATSHGGFGAFDRRKFLELGGYDDLYLPGRLEDADICFRAARKGWKILYEPASVVTHEGGTSFHKSFGVSGTLVVNWRNTILFMVKNLGQGTLWKLLLWLPAHVTYHLLRGRPEMAIGCWQAVRRLPEARKRRQEMKRQGLFVDSTDREIFKILNGDHGV